MAIRLTSAGLILAGLLLLVALGASRAQPVTGAGHAAVVSIEGPIGAASSGYWRKARDRAVEKGAAVIVLRIDTPGGLDGAMREMIKDILDAPVPVIGWVGPSGARAASAGTFLLYAAHVAAMAPGTNLGAATPVPLGGGGGMPSPRAPIKPERRDKAGDKAEGATEPAEREPAEAADAMGQKLLNDAIAYIRSLADLRGRNADWAEAAVRMGASLGATEALEKNVIDLVASDVQELLVAVDGRSVKLRQGEIQLATAELQVVTYEPDWRDRLLATIANPTVAYLLMLVGIYGLLLEGYNPGAFLPGIVGGISLLLGLYALQVLPVNYAGLALMILGLALMIGEALVPSFGVLGFGGIVAFVLGSVLLIDTDIPGYGVDPWLIGGIATAAGLLLMMTVVLLMRARRARVSAGEALPLGTELRVAAVSDAVIWGQVDGERWRLKCSQPLTPGQRVIVERVEGLTLVVRPATD